MKRCPNCNNRIFAGDKKCSQCNEPVKFKNRKSKTEETDPRHGLCGNIAGENYCPLPGSIKDGVIWLCRWHYKSRNNPFISQQILVDVQKPGKLRHYLGQLNQHLRYEAEHRQHAAEYDVVRRAGESIKDYKHRMIKHMHNMVGSKGLLKRVSGEN